MQNIETAIRNALKNVEADQAAERRRVYESAWHAHERFLSGNDALSDEDCTRRRDALTQLIMTIESEYEAAYPVKEYDSVYGIGPEEYVALENESATQMNVARKRTKRPIKLFAFIAIVIALVATLSWSFYNSLVSSLYAPDQGSAEVLQEQGGRQNNTIGQLDSKPADTNGNDGFIEVFIPRDVASVSVRGGASAEMHTKGDENFVRIVASHAADAAVIELGEGIINSIRGKNVTFDILARSVGGKTSQLGITCDFGGGVNCGRRRFEVPVTQEHMLFDLTVGAEAHGAGRLFITTDLLGEGKAVDIFSVRVRTMP